MKALKFNGKDLELSEVAKPAGNGEALIRVLRSGICNTDLEIVHGYANFRGTIGHEFCGVVEESSEIPELIGKRVVGEINAGCGRCELCVGGDPRHCPERTVLGIHGRDGCHAEFITLPGGNLFELPDSISDEGAVFVEPLAAAVGITEQLEIRPETKVAVIGDGKLGLLCAMRLTLQSKNVVLIGKHDTKLSIARKRNIETLDLLRKTADFDRQFDVVVEASGSESGFSTALDLVKPRGKIVLKSTFHGKPVWDAARVVVNEITIVGSRCGRFAPAIGLLESGTVDVTDLINDVFDLNDGLSAFKRAAEKGVMKVILTTEK